MKNNLKKIIIIPATLGIALTLGACKPYDKPEFKEIKPNQTAFIIPLEGDTKKQAQFDSEELLQNAQVLSKRVKVPHKWIKTGRMPFSGKYVDTVKVLVVDRYPETREWKLDDSFVGESRDSVKFTQGLSATAQIQADDAAKFLYKYSGKSLKEVMDTEIRNKIGSVLLEQYSSSSIETIRADKSKVIEAVRKEVEPYFKSSGITLSNIGYIGDMKYTDKGIQEAINKKFNAQENAKAQKIESNADIEKARADAEANNIRSKSMDDIKAMRTIELKEKELDVKEKMIEKWDGKLPTVTDGKSSIINIP